MPLQIVSTGISENTQIALQLAITNSGMSMYGYLKALVLQDMLDNGYMQPAHLSKAERELMKQLRRFHSQRP